MPVIQFKNEPPLPSEFDGLSVFIVGGWVRDSIRGKEPSDVDIMVAGVSKEELIDRGFTEIDSSNNETFGVFLDSLGREVAMAREESSTGDSHTDFEVEPVPASVHSYEALFRDLERRDFTINAMAYEPKTKRFFDPHNGVQDLSQGVIRAVDTTAFKQDPLRILRASRFAARLGFSIDQETTLAMIESRSKLSELPAERLRLEMEKALVQSEKPSQFFDVLSNIDALETTFPELARLEEVPAGPKEYHKEGSAFRHTMMVLDEMNRIDSDDELGLLMALTHDMGKGTTDEAKLPSHPAHGKRGVPVIESMAARLGMNNEQARVAKSGAYLHMRMHDFDKLNESTLLKTFKRAKIGESTENVERLVALMLADSRGRVPSSEYPTWKAYQRFLITEDAINAWTGQRLIEAGYSPDEMGGKEFGDLLTQKRIEYIREEEQ